MAAAEQAAKRMAAPVISAGLTTAIAFTGLLAIGGRFGKMLEGLAIVVAMVLLASLVESLLVLPNHMRHALARGRGDWADVASSRVNRGFDALRDRALRPAVRGLVRFRWPALGLAFALLAFAIAQLQTGALPWRCQVARDCLHLAKRHGRRARGHGDRPVDVLEPIHGIAAAVDDVLHAAGPPQQHRVS